MRRLAWDPGGNTGVLEASEPGLDPARQVSTVQDHSPAFPNDPPDNWKGNALERVHPLTGTRSDVGAD